MCRTLEGMANHGDGIFHGFLRVVQQPKHGDIAPKQHVMASLCEILQQDLYWVCDAPRGSMWDMWQVRLTCHIHVRNCVGVAQIEPPCVCVGVW